MKKILFISLLIAVFIPAVIYAGDFNDAFESTQTPGNLSDEEFLQTYFTAIDADITTALASGGGGVSNWSNDGTTTELNANSSVYATNASGIFSVAGLSVGAQDLTLTNSQMILGNTNNSVVIQENSDTLTFGFDGSDINITASDGSIELIPESSTADGSIDLLAGGDTDDFIEIILSEANKPEINFSGCDGIIVASGGDISFGDENIATTGTLAAGATTVTGAVTASSADINSGDITLENDETISNGTDGTIELTSSGATVVKIESGSNATNAELVITADKDDDAADDWVLRSVASDNDFHLLNGTTLKLTVDTNGNILTTNDLTVGGTTPCTFVGDGGDEDAGIRFSAASVNYYIAKDDTGNAGGEDSLVFGIGTVYSTDNRLIIGDSTTSSDLTVGDGVDSYDKAIFIDGNATDAYWAYDDSSDDSVFGVGGTVGTLPGLVIDGADASCSIGLATNATVATGANDLFVADACEIAGDLSTSTDMTISNCASTTGTCYYLVIKSDGTVGRSAITFGG